MISGRHTSPSLSRDMYVDSSVCVFVTLSTISQGGKKLERARDLFEQALDGCPAKCAKSTSLSLPSSLPLPLSLSLSPFLSPSLSLPPSHSLLPPSPSLPLPPSLSLPSLPSSLSPSLLPPFLPIFLFLSVRSLLTVC